MNNWQPDVATLASNGFWIMGLAVMLATWSYAYWTAQMNDRSLSQEMSGRRYLVCLLLGLLLVSIGLIGIGKSWWSQLPAVGLLLVCLAALLLLWRRHQAPHP
jgi:hypothetical protein